MDQHSRLIVQWPAGSNFPGFTASTQEEKFTLFGGEEITRAQLRSTDTLLAVVFNRPLLTESLFDEAYAENAERSQVGEIFEVELTADELAELNLADVCER